MIIDIDAFNALGYTGNHKYDYTSIGKIIDAIHEQADGKDATLVIAGSLADSDQAYHLLRYIVLGKTQGAATAPREPLEIEHYDFSKMNLGADGKFPFNIFDIQEFKQGTKSIKLPVMTDANLDSQLLDGCTALEELEFAEGSTITKLQYNFCYGCTSLKDVNLEVLTSLTEVSQNSFRGCTALEEITFPESVTTISDTAFDGCSALKKLDVSSTNLKTLGQSAFQNCTSLEEVTLSEHITTIGTLVFSGCKNLKTFTIPADAPITTFGDQDMFNNCTKLETVNLSNNIKTINDNTFDGCSALKNISIPASVKTLGQWAFHNCTSLYSYEHNGEPAGFIIEPRVDKVNIGYLCFENTHVRAQDLQGYYTSGSPDSQIFIEL